MSDLVKRLREFDKAFDAKYEYDIAHEAADEIERLHSINNGLDEVHRQRAGELAQAHLRIAKLEAMVAIAKQALQEKADE